MFYIIFIFLVYTRDIRFDSKVGQIDPKMGQFRDFFRSDFSTFWLGEPKCTEILSLSE